MTNVRIDVITRYAKFLAGLIKSSSLEVRLMYWTVKGDIQSTVGHNMSLIQTETSLNPSLVSSQAIKKAMVKAISPVPVTDSWRLPYLDKLLSARGEASYLGEDTAMLTSYIDSLCSS